MARFYSSIQGNRGVATRGGSKDSGIHGHVRGWDTGVRVHGHVTTGGEDEFTVYLTGGSNGRTADRQLGTLLADGRFIAAGHDR